MAANPVLYGTSSLPYAPLAPSPSALTLSSDGQYAIVTRGEINLLTPALGFSNAAPTSGTSAPAPLPQAKGKGKQKESAAPNGKDRERIELPLLRTVIPVEKKNCVKWPQWVDEYELVVPGAVEPWWRAASWSPSGLSSLGGCVLATLTTNAEVLLFAPEKDAHKGEWNEVYDLTAELVKRTVPDDGQKHDEQTPHARREAVASIRGCQTSALAWSPVVPELIGDYSLLALGHRSGEVSLWRYHPDCSMELHCRFRPAGDASWINVMSWSSRSTFSTEQSFEASALLALADADGRVWSVQVSQTIPTGGKPEITVSTTVLLADADKRGATQLCWIERETTRQLAISKLGTVEVLDLIHDVETEGGWKAGTTHEVELRTEGAEDWMGATAWAPCSGLQYLSARNALLVSLSSASFHLISLDPSPTLAPTESDSLTATSRKLFDAVLGRSRARKDRFATEASGKVTRKEGAKLLGFVGLESGKKQLDVAYIFETERPGSFSQRTATGTRTYFTIANLATIASTSQETTQELSDTIGSPLNARVQLPLSRLQPLLNHLVNHVSDVTLLDGLLEHLRSLPLPPSPPVGDTMSSLTKQLMTDLFGEKGLEGLRVKEVITRLLANQQHVPESHRHATLVTHISLARQLIKEVLSRIATTIGTIPLSESEKSLHSRLLLSSASLLPATDLDSPSEQDVLPPDTLREAYEHTDETCPACKAVVPLDSVRFARCVEGHQWERCSITLALVSTVKVRTCTACERKALLQVPDAGVINEVLKAATCCVYCGGRWMKVR
ncbi:hypothetical protein JCM11641_005138 [Rhodosporidiobolus odoratus]